MENAKDRALPAGAKSEQDHDCWGTPYTVAREIVRYFVEQGNARHVSPAFEFLEPSAGRGVFLDALRHAGASRFEAYDIIPEFSGGPHGIKCGNFLELVEAGAIPWKVDRFGIGNPPFSGGQDCAFVRALRRVCNSFALILPIGLLEPAQVRSEGGRDADLYDGLRAIYPLRRIRYDNLIGTKSTAGKRPSAVYYFAAEHFGDPDSWRWRTPPPITLDYTIQRMIEGAGKCRG